MADDMESLPLLEFEKKKMIFFAFDTKPKSQVDQVFKNIGQLDLA